MKERTITYATYLNKVYGGWMGKSIGGTVGAPFESHKIFGDATADNCWPKTIFPNDDLDIQIVWLEMLEEAGPRFTRDDLVRFWQDRCWYNFVEYGFFLYNVQRGIHPPLSGEFNNQFYGQSEGCPIRAEIWGMVNPGDTKRAAEFARLDGELDHIGNSVWAEQFWAAAVAEAFFADDLEEAIEAGRNVVPVDSDIYRISYEVPTLWKKHGNLRRVWLELIRHYGHRDNSKAEINFAFSLLPLYVANGNFKEAIVTAINCGWDSDCTAATSGALLGVFLGAAALPEDWKLKMGETLSCDVNVRHKNSLISEVSEDTCKAGLEVMFSRNHPVGIVNIPADILADVNMRTTSRPQQASINMESCYPTGPVLYTSKATEVKLAITYTGAVPLNGTLIVTAPEGIHVSPCTLRLTLSPGDTQQIMFNVRMDPGAHIIWDKNLLEACLALETGERFKYGFGFVGSRQWHIYGPYWDAWDTTKWDVCPYRNDELITHPVFVEGCEPMLVHEYVRLDRPYLDETHLQKEEIPEEVPYTVECGEDRIGNADLGGFFGEACFYLTRDVVSREPVECNVNIGSTGPFIVWLDGEEVLRHEGVSSWGPHDFMFRAMFDMKPRRLVIKCVRPGDDFQLSLCFRRLNSQEDKTKGVSYLLDCLGEVILGD